MAAKKKMATKRKAAPKAKAGPKRETAPKRKAALKTKAAPKSKAAAKKKAAARRELIDTGTNKLFVRRNTRGTSFKKVVDAGKSITRDKRTKAKRKVPSGQGDRGDRR
jgi:hypothetical protein